MDLDLQLQQKQFNSAMYKYTNRKIYKLFGKLVSFINVSFQIYLLYLVIQISISAFWNVAAFIEIDKENRALFKYICYIW